jgi:hypothetical protein
VITDEHRRQILVADRTRDVDVLAKIIDSVVAENPDTTPLDVETALRDATGHCYLVAEEDGISIVLGMPAWRDALQAAGMTPEQNRAALAAISED